MTPGASLKVFASPADVPLTEGNLNRGLKRAFLPKEAPSYLPGRCPSPWGKDFFFFWNGMEEGRDVGALVGELGRLLALFKLVSFRSGETGLIETWLDPWLAPPCYARPSFHSLSPFRRLLSPFLMRMRWGYFLHYYKRVRKLLLLLFLVTAAAFPVAAAATAEGISYTFMPESGCGCCCCRWCL